MSIYSTTTDISKPASLTFPNLFIYSASKGSATLGSRSWVFDDSSSILVTRSPGNWGFFFNGGVNAENLNFSLSLNTSQHEGSLELPSELPPIEDFDIVRNLSVFSDNDGLVNGVQARIDSFTLTPVVASAIPESSTYGVVGMTVLLGLLAQRWLAITRFRPGA